jgi:WD40 repeat protein
MAPLAIDDKADTKIAAISVAQVEDRIVILMSDSRLVSVPIIGADTGQNAGPMLTLLPPHHIKVVTAINIAFRKQLFVSGGDDHSIRVWNHDEMKCEIAKFFPDALLCVSFHPNGGSIVADFAEKLRSMAITINDILTHREFLIRSCRFSHGGQYFVP